MKLAKFCHLDVREAVEEFRHYKNNTRRIGSTLAFLLQRVKLLPVSSAECERGFSCMNLNDTDVRNRLTINSLSALIFLKVNGPEPSKFNPTTYVEKWLQEGHHASSDAATGKKNQAKNTSRLWPAYLARA